MRCREAQDLLHSYSDGELDVLRHVQIEEHLGECPECAKQVEHLRLLRTAISSASLYQRAPAALRARVQLAAPPISPGRRRPSLRMFALAAGILLLIGASATIGLLVFRAGTDAEDRLAEWVVASHVRSLQVEHLTDVVSSDQHTVKPWFRGKLDFSPLVVDLSPQGYALSGGRLDYLAGRPVAALVYFRRSHAINLFIWPAGNDKETAVRALSRQGFQIRNWQRSGMIYWAISDVNDQEIDEFVRLLQQRSPDSPL
jgi:anti-sigma factor RsiW